MLSEAELVGEAGKLERDHLATKIADPTRTALPMEACDEDRLPEHVTVHGVDHCHTGICGFLRRALRDIELRVERIELERVVMVRTGWCARTHVRVRTQTDLTASIRK